MKNHIGRPFLLLLCAVGVLFLLHFLPVDHIGKYEVKPIRLLSEITKDDTSDSIASALAELPKVATPPSITQKESNSSEEWQEDILDYADSTGRGMVQFHQALAKREKLGRPVRIAYFGDSFIEGDILTADLRYMLQNYFGGNGAGFSDISSPFTQYRASLPLFSEGWDVRNVLMKDSCENYRLGPTQRYAIPKEEAFSEVRGTRLYAHLDSFETATIYLRTYVPHTIHIQKDGGSSQQFTTRGDGSIESLTTCGKMHRIRWNVPSDSTTTCYGIALEGKQGITVDNFSFRGSSGITLGSIPQRQWNDIAQVRPYDLIVLHFGLNVASKNILKYDYYVTGIKHAVNRLKKAYPEAGFLIISVSDREDKIDGELQTMPGIKALVRYQQKIAADNHIAFWNLYQAMGGEGSIVKMANEKPHQARKDYTHITHDGGKTIAELLYKAILRDFNKYVKANNHE